MTASFRRVFLLMLSGPIIWAGHFLFVYASTGIVCARPSSQLTWMGMDMATWMVVIASVLSIAAIGAIQFRMRTRMPAAGDARFVPVMTRMLALLSVLAILWETLPAFLVPACG